MPEVHGKLARDVLPEVLRHFGFLLESGRLEVWSGTSRGVVIVRDGRPVHAACRGPDGATVQGVEALAIMLDWPAGEYVFAELREDPGESPHAGIGSNGSAHGSEHALAHGSERAHTNGSGAIHAPSLAGDTEDILERARSVQRGRVVVRGGTPRVLRRVSVEDPGGVVTLSRGALDLWWRIDGATPLAALAQDMGRGGDELRTWAAELRHAGLVESATEPVYGPEFVAGVIEIVNEIMGPMGEIVVEDGLHELGLDPAAIPDDRVDSLVTSLAYQLQRSDWQMKLRARVTRLRTEMRDGY